MLSVTLYRSFGILKQFKDEKYHGKIVLLTHVRKLVIVYR